MKKDRSALKATLIGAAALLYGASPIDLIPEILAGPLGFGDDAVVLIGAGVAIWRIMRNRNDRRRQQHNTYTVHEDGTAPGYGRP
jgi:uncharacterized membrane protein YkvA (DUF1232 family)